MRWAALWVLLCLGPSYGLAKKLPTGFVYLRDIDPTILQDIRYASSNNFIGKRLKGYKAGECVLARPVATALSRVQSALQKEGRSLVVYDCYRPVRAVRMMVDALRNSRKTVPEYYPRFTGKELLAKGYVASRSGHSSGGSVDLGLVSQSESGIQPVDMGTKFDFFDPKSHLLAKEITAKQSQNRRQLQQVMRLHGFVGYTKEWWHFRYANEPFRHRQFDFPIAKREGK